MVEQTAGKQQRGFMARLRAVPWRVWVALVIAALALAFILQNQNTAGIYLLQISIHAPMWVFLLVIWLVGLLVGLMFGRRKRREP